MFNLIKRVILNKGVLTLIDILIAPFVFISSYLFLFIRKVRIERMKISKKIFLKVGVYPIMDHYYEPLFNPAHLNKSLREDRILPELDFNITEQINMLKNFNYNDELIKLPFQKEDDFSFYYNNDTFNPGDSEYLYNTIRFLKPKQIIEIGCGNSTLMTLEAIKQNKNKRIQTINVNKFV
jgi:hypothetical protein